ncbi:LytTR family DNA-binding domain-containing protein [Lachnospiraceae bacterium 48-33]
MIYKIAICDDETIDTDYLCGLVEKWAAYDKHTVQIKTFVSAEEFLFHYEEDKVWHILLLDIEMGKINGVELAKKIRIKNKEVQIIFITGYNDYISDGYDVEALHYILKPVYKEKLYEVLSRACERLEKEEAALFLHLPDGMVRIPFYEIRYMEVRANYVTVYGEEKVTIKTTLSALEQELDNRFFRIGRSYIVNMKYIRKVTKRDVILEDNTAVPISRGYYESLNRAFIDYF